MVGADIPQLARHARSNEGFACDIEATCATMAWITASLTPSVALSVTIGSFVKNASEMVLVPGSSVGNEAMNCAGSHCRFCAKWISPTLQTQFS